MLDKFELKGKRIEYTVFDGTGFIKGGEGVFVQFGMDFEEFENGVGNYSTAIFISDSGKIVVVPANQITFIDDKPADTTQHKMEITKVEVLENKTGTDTILLTTNLPEPVWPFKDRLILKIEVARDTAENYIKKHLNKNFEL